METIFIKTENSEKKSLTIFSQFNDKPNLKNPNKNIALGYLSIYQMQKKIKSANNNNKFKISAPTWNDEFDLPEGSYSVSDIQDYFEYVIKNMKQQKIILPYKFTSTELKTGLFSKQDQAINQNYSPDTMILKM